MEHLLPLFELLDNGKLKSNEADIRVYERSISYYNDDRLVMVQDKGIKKLLVCGQERLYQDLEGSEIKQGNKVCPLNHKNRLVINRYFEYTVPQPFGSDMATLGLGDRLGLASPGHIQTIRNKQIKPILAQQSIRELNLTNRTMSDVLDAACFAVFQEGYKGGFGADGDHLKEENDIQAALEQGMSMLTLDCSDYIRNNVETVNEEQIRVQYNNLPEELKQYYKANYLNQSFNINDLTILFDESTLMKTVLLYGEAIKYMGHIYKKYVSGKNIDFEVSIDETITTTTPQAHFFVANELKQQNIRVTSLAPRFCGEFQKGIDYIGDIEEFEREFQEHVTIANYFGYKVSIHSGSDKFTVFPLIAKYTKGLFHVKTAGTNWLEAIKVIAETNPSLYRRMHTYALDHFNEALQYYHITPDLSSIKSIESVSDDHLKDYMNHDAARQLFHVTFGLLLSAEDEEGLFKFKHELFDTLTNDERKYREALIAHIGNHLKVLGY